MAKVKEDISRVRLEVDGNEAINQLGKLEMEAKDLSNEFDHIKQQQAIWIKESKNLEKIEERFQKLIASQRKLKEEGKQNSKVYENNQKKINALVVELNTARKAAENLTKSERELAAVDDKMKGNTAEVAKLRKELGMAGQTMRQLMKYKRELNNIKYNSTFGSDAYIDAENKLRQADNEINRRRSLLTGNGAGFFAGIGGAIKKIAPIAGIFLGAQGIFEGIKKSIGASSEFEQSLSNLSAITGAVGSELKFLENEAKNIGSTTTFTASEAAKAFELIASKKPELLENRDALVAVSKAAITLAEAAGIELPQAADALTNTMNQFGAGAEDANRFINTLAAGSKFGAGSIDYLNDSVKRFGPVAKSMNISFEESVAMMEVFAEKGLESEKSGVQFRNILVKLAAGADETNPAIVGMNKAIENLGKQQLNTAELAKRFGTENLVAAQILTESGARFEEFTKKVTGTSVAMDQAKIRVDNFKGLMKEFGSIAEYFMIAFGSIVQDAITPFVRGIVDAGIALKDFFNAADSSKRVLDEQTSSMNSLNSAIEPLMERYWELETSADKSKEEQEELRDIIKKITDLIPTAATGFDKYGNALGFSTKKVIEFREAQIAANKILNANAIKENTEELTDLEAELVKVNKQLNTTNKDGDVVKMITTGYGFDRASQEVKMAGEEITALQVKVKGLYESINGRKFIIENLTGEKSPETIEREEAERQAILKKAQDEADKESEADRLEKEARAAEKAAEARQQKIDDEKKMLEQLAKDWEGYQAQLLKLKRDYEIIGMTDQKAELARSQDTFTARKAELDEFLKNNILSKTNYDLEINKLHDLQKQEESRINEKYRLKEEEEKEKILEKAENRINSTIEGAMNEEEQRALAIQRTNEYYDELVSIYEKYKWNTTDLEKARGIELADIQKKQDAEQIKKAKEVADAKISLAQGLSSALGAAIDFIGNKQGELTGFQKALTVAQIAIDTASSLSKIIPLAIDAARDTGPAAPFVLAGYIATMAATVFGAAAKAKNALSESNVPEYNGDSEEKGPARGRASSETKKKSFFWGGDTGSESLGSGDQYGPFVGAVHANEYVIPKITTQNPVVANLLPMIEQVRQDNKKGFNGNTGGGVSGASSAMDAESKALLREMVNEIRSMKNKKVVLIPSELQVYEEERVMLDNKYTA